MNGVNGKYDIWHSVVEFQVYGKPNNNNTSHVESRGTKTVWMLWLIARE